MGRVMQQLTRTACAALLLSAFMACKKKSDEPAPAASVSPATEQAAAAAVSAAAAQAAAAQAAAQVAAAGAPAAVDAGAPAPVLGEVKRFADKEKAATGSTKVLLDQSKVYDEPDATKLSVVSLSKDLVVTRLATLGTDWTLIEFPSGVGKVSPGWIESKSLVGGGAVSTVASAKPATSATAVASASAKPAATAVAPAVPAATATAAPVPTVKPKPGAILRPPPHP